MMRAPFRVAVITGASSGLGAALASAYARPRPDRRDRVGGWLSRTGLQPGLLRQQGGGAGLWRSAAGAARTPRRRRYRRVSGVFRLADDRPVAGTDPVPVERRTGGAADQARDRQRPPAHQLSVAAGRHDAVLRPGTGDQRRRDRAPLPLSYSVGLSGMSLSWLLHLFGRVELP